MKKFAYSSLCCKYIDQILELEENCCNYAIEWDLNFIPPILNELRLNKIKEKIALNGILVRYHLPYAFWDIGSNNDEVAYFSYKYMERCLNFIFSLGGTIAVIHIGQEDDSSINNAIKYLKLLSSISKKLGISLCVENLTKGLSKKIKFWEQCIKITDLFLCLDTGHAKKIFDNDDKFYKFYLEHSEKIIHSHVYYNEDDRFNHVPFCNYNLYENKWLHLLFNTNCDWFTMELDSLESQKDQLTLLQNGCDKL